MRILGLDIGEKWIGVALSDPIGMLASPLTRVRASDDEAAVRDIARIVKEQDAGLVVAGMPYSLSGAVGPQARHVQEFVDLLVRSLPVPVETCDERSSTVAAEQMMAEAGIPREKRKEKVDAVAAAFILQSYLDRKSTPSAGVEDEFDAIEDTGDERARSVTMVALIGHPVEHSISPRFQQAAFDHYGLETIYEPWDTPLSELFQVIERLRRHDILGANVTIPHKEAVLDMVDVVDDLARQIGAVNTIANREGRLHAFNTDASGFIQALRRDGAFSPEGKSALVLGAGGAARAVSFALVREGVRRLTVANRKTDRAHKLVAALKAGKARGETGILDWAAVQEEGGLAGYDLIVNCTPLGMKHSPTEGESPIPAGAIPENALVCDLVYNPIETVLIREARIAGARVLGGLAMLVYQGAVSFEIWTGREAPVDLMLQVAKDSLT